MLKFVSKKIFSTKMGTYDAKLALSPSLLHKKMPFNFVAGSFIYAMFHFSNIKTRDETLQTILNIVANNVLHTEGKSCSQIKILFILQKSNIH